jgi:transposase
MSDELRNAGLQPYLAHSRKVAGWREARGLAKNNKLDADLISELWSQQPRWWEVWLAPPEVRDRREWLRYRMSLVQSQTQCKNRIHAVLHGHGILDAHSDLFGVGGRRFLNQLADARDGTLPRSTSMTLRGYLQLLDTVRRQIAQATREIRRQIKASPEARRLKTIPGISWILAYTLWAEIGDIARFKNAKHLASYSLLAPQDNESGEEHPTEAPQGRWIGHIGRRTLKWAFIEAARGAQRRSARFREVFNRRTDNGKKERNRGHITVAHHLCSVVYVLLKKGVDYTETPPPRPGTNSTSRPGMG